VANVRIGLLNSVFVQGVYIEDQSKDTLLYAGEIDVRITDWFIFKDKPVLHYVGLTNAFVNMNRGAGSKTWNYDFIADAFASPKKKKSSNNSNVEFDLKKVRLENVRVHMNDAWIGEDLRFDVGSLLVNSDGLDFKKKVIDISKIKVSNTIIGINEYVGGRPKHLRPKYLDTFDVTPFNPDMWGVNIKSISLEECGFRLKSDDEIPARGEFDESHIEIGHINIDVSAIRITGDTIRGDINSVTAQERSGIEIKKMSCKATVSPIASVCKDLYLETNHSVLKDYYAMHYRHFPDFNHYIDSVTMVAHLKESKVDKRDIAYFAPQLTDFPEMQLTVSGNGKGTVANLSASKLTVSDGNVALKCNVTMKGLPDIYTTYITFTDGQILTTGKGVMHYAPALKGNPNFAADSITYAFFKGSYEGYIENFRVNGILKTNLGSVGTDMKMSLPGFRSDDASYSGVVTADKLLLGKIIRQPLLGTITLNEKVSGRSFTPELLQLHLDGVIKEFALNNYLYHNITTHGTLAKKQFDGMVQVDDPNLALGFDGGINYSGKQAKINATAHLLACNFKALNLVSDIITGSADFDLNCTGSSIDDFSGYAKLFNLDLKKNDHKLAIDSVFVRSSGPTTARRIDINSDAFTASVNGNYRLSDLPASVQYYLSRYIPNYIKAPAKYAPDQDLTFKITTAHVDSIFALTVPMLRGFENATVSGALNTTTKKLLLNASVPYARVGTVQLHNVSVIGEGDFNVIGLNTNIEDIALGDSVLHGEMSITATLGNDSVAFSIATGSPDKEESSITLNGRIAAYSDTLQLSVLKSQFYMRRAKWDIAGGSSVVYSKNYLSVSGVSLTSGVQRVTAATDPAQGNRLLVQTENLDLAWLGNIAGISYLQPDGRLNGNITAENIFTNVLVKTNLHATNVKLGADTVGSINLVGSYDQAKNVVRLDPETGVYRDNASVSASGKYLLDTTKNMLAGTVVFNNARVAWAAPFLTGIFSNISGVVNGTVNVTGSQNKPIMEGQLTASDVAFRLDYMGCNYTIPTATIGLTNQRISLSRVQVYDVYKNTATLSGYFSHELFANMRMRLKVTTPKMELMNLGQHDNELFYGKLIAGMDSFTIRGPFNNIRLNLYNGYPAAKSTIFIPASSGGYVGAYSYVSFKTYGTDQEKPQRKSKDKITINLDANLNTLAEIHIVLDPATGDEIVATGTGNIQMDLPPNNDMSMKGMYTINQGTYTLTFQQVAIHRVFRLNQGSTISFNGPFAETNLAVDAVYPAKARLYDLLSTTDKTFVKGNELIDAQTPQVVNVSLHMRGPIYSSQLTFDIDLENKHSQSTLAYTKLMLINRDDRQKFDQVASLLLVGAFIPPEGLGQSAVSGAINNVSQIISSTASTGLTQIVNHLIGDRNLNVNVKYNNYNYSDQSLQGNINRSQLKLGVTKNYLNDRLLVSVGSTSDWGKPASSGSATTFNVAGDFRLQYQLSQFSNLRFNVFHNSDYDLTIDRNIQRSGVGISWRKSFDNVGEFFRGNKYALKQKQKQLQLMQASLDSAAKKEE